LEKYDSKRKEQNAWRTGAYGNMYGKDKDTLIEQLQTALHQPIILWIALKNIDIP